MGRHGSSNFFSRTLFSRKIGAVKSRVQARAGRAVFGAFFAAHKCSVEGRAEKPEIGACATHDAEIINEIEYEALRTNGTCLILREGEALYTARLAERHEQKSIPGSTYVLVGYAEGARLSEIAVVTEVNFC